MYRVPNSWLTSYKLLDKYSLWSSRWFQYSRKSFSSSSDGRDKQPLQGNPFGVGKEFLFEQRKSTLLRPENNTEAANKSSFSYVNVPNIAANPLEHPFQLVEKEYQRSTTTKQQVEGERSDNKITIDDTITMDEVELPRIVDEQGRAYGIGARKTSTCEVWLKQGTGNYFVNGRSLVKYFRETRLIEEALEPLLLFHIATQFDADCFVVGGGQSGQAGALKHGIAHALKLYDPSYYPELFKLRYLLRDPRMVEPKKIGRKKARKKEQWSKR
eukprot:jgi/Galph1/4705/GphlegSOOS_G3366.1